jgi:hypothetical protein
MKLGWNEGLSKMQEVIAWMLVNVFIIGMLDSRLTGK